MSEDQKKSGVAFWASCFTVAIALAYLGAYASTVDSGGVVDGFVHGPLSVVPVGYSSPCQTADALFYRNQDILRRFFAPIHWVDRHLRPDTWYVKN